MSRSGYGEIKFPPEIILISHIKEEKKKISSARLRGEITHIS